jgi:hypothetical protein
MAALSRILGMSATPPEQVVDMEWDEAWAVSDEELWTGPMGAYVRNGFVEVSDFEPYPVLRRVISGGS